METNSDIQIQSDNDSNINLSDPKAIDIEEEESDDSGETPSASGQRNDSVHTGSVNSATENMENIESGSSNQNSLQENDNSNPKTKKTQSKNKSRKMKKKSAKKSASNSENNLPIGIAAPPKRRNQFDGSDIDVKTSKGKSNQTPMNISLGSQQTLSTLSESYSQNEQEPNATDRNIQKISHISSDLSGINTSQLESTASTKMQTDRDLSQVPLRNDSQSDFKQKVKNAVVSIKSHPKPAKEKESVTQSDAVEYSLADYSVITDEEVRLSNVPVHNDPNFKSRVKNAVVSIKSDKVVNPQEMNTTSQFHSSQSGRSDLSNQQVHIDLSKQQRKSPKGHLRSKQNNETYEEDEEEEYLHGSSSQIPGELSENTSSDYLNGISEFEAVREVKYRIDDLVSPAMRPYLAKGLRVRPSEQATEGVVGRLQLPVDNGEMVFDSEVSDLDVEFNTDKKKFQKPQIIGKTPTSKIPTLDSKSRSRRYTTPRTPYSIPDLDSSEASSFYSSESSELQVMTRDIVDEIEQEDSLITNPMKFDIQEADSDDDRCMFEQFRKNADLRLSSSSQSSSASSGDEAPPVIQNTPAKQHSDESDEEEQQHRPNEQVIEEFVVTPRSIQPNHKDRTVTKGKIQLYLLSSSSSDDQQVDENDDDENEDTFVKTRGVNNLSDSSNDEDQPTPKKVKSPKKSESEDEFDGNVKLKVTVVEARNLPESQTLAIDPYCMISVKDKKKWQRTKTLRSTTKPIWDQQFTFSYNIYQPNTLTKRDVFLYIRVLSEDKFVGDRDLSSNQINLKDMKMSQFIDKWIRLHPSDSRKRGGEIHLTFLIEKNSTDVEVSPRRVSLREPEPNYYLLSPRAQTPTPQTNPFDEDNDDEPIQRNQPQERRKTPQTPTETNSLRSWTTTSSSDSKNHTSDKNGTCSLPKIQNFGEEEEEEEEEEEAIESQNQEELQIEYDDNNSSESKNTPEEDLNEDLQNKNRNGSLSPISPPSENNQPNHHSFDLDQLPSLVDSPSEAGKHTPVEIDEISGMSGSATNEKDDELQNDNDDEEFSSPPLNSFDDEDNNASSSNIVDFEHDSLIEPTGIVSLELNNFEIDGAEAGLTLRLSIGSQVQESDEVDTGIWEETFEFENVDSTEKLNIEVIRNETVISDTQVNIASLGLGTRNNEFDLIGKSQSEKSRIKFTTTVNNQEN